MGRKRKTLIGNTSYPQLSLYITNRYEVINKILSNSIKRWLILLNMIKKYKKR